MADFKTAYQKTMKIEAGYANNPNDHGGETWRGIARNYHPKWAGWGIIDSFKNKPGFEANLSASQTLERLVQELYKQEFWDVMWLDQFVNQDIAEEMFDTGANMDPRFPIEFLQKAINATSNNQLVVDGRMGPATLKAVNDHPKPKKVFILLNCQQGCRYMDISLHNPSQKQFMSSWLSRIAV